ncbi:hypothetical protein Lfu02_40780 [Longispora fulva]|nr:hypothetical protein Lfu02_40780 [Longispora fulva]
MIFELQPQTGVPPILFGMTVEEARAAMESWGVLEDATHPVATHRDFGFAMRI